jgi:hypothetical protein
VHRVLGHAETPREYGVRYRIGRAPSNPAQVEVFQSASGLKVFRDERIGEPIWVERDAPCAAEDRLRVLRRLPEASDFAATLGCPGRVVVGDAYYRGWRAYVDGRRVPVEEAAGGIRAVRVGAGEHRLEFRYRPASVYIGGALTALGLALAAFLRRLGP